MTGHSRNPFLQCPHVSAEPPSGLGLRSCRACQFAALAKRASILAGLFEEIGNESSPTRLVTGPDTRANIAMKVLVEWDVVAPERIFLEQSVAAEHGPVSLCITHKDAREPLRQVVRHLSQIHQLA